MILLKTAFKNLRKNAALSLLVTAQTAALFLAAAAALSTVYPRLETYLPFKDYYSAKGYFFSCRPAAALPTAAAKRSRPRTR